MQYHRYTQTKKGHTRNTFRHYTQQRTGTLARTRVPLDAEDECLTQYLQETSR